MKTLILSCFLTILSGPFLMAQNQTPKHRTKHSSFILPNAGDDARNAARILQELFNMTNMDALRSFKFETDRHGLTHEKFQQYYGGLKVDGATITVHSRNNQVYLMSGNYQDIADVSPFPSISGPAALETALAHVRGRRYIWEQEQGPKPAGELVVYADPDLSKAARLAYKFDIYAIDPLYRAYVYIDAHTGEFLAANARLHDTDTPATASTRYNGAQSVTADYTGSNYRLRQTANGNGIETYSMKNGTDYAAAADVTSPTTTFSSDPTANQAHWGAEQTYKYFMQKHGRNSYDNKGSVIKSYVHYSVDYVNAFWDGSRLTFGDGDGVQEGPLVSLDICGHELTHGVTEYSAGLVYRSESGALNESFSDIFGEAVEHFTTGATNWLVGSQIGIGGYNATIRSMKDPSSLRHPDTYGGSYWVNPNCGSPGSTNDYCGVHTNSGVQNKWFYVLSVGESGVNDLGNSYNVSGIGIEKALSIAYRNLTVYLTSTSSFADARSGSIQAATDLYGAGSPEVIATTNAWYAVGVGGAYGAISYCTAAGTDPSFEWISRVAVGSFTNASASAGYTNFTSLTFSLNAGQTYNVTLTPGFAGSAYGEYWRAWIDYNGDGDFADAGEQVFDSGAPRSVAVTGTITIPGSATGTTRMRVAMKYNGAPASCETFAYGEVEDYSVTFSAPAPDSQPPSAPLNLSASNTTQNSTVLSWTASTDNVGVDHYNIYVGGTLKGTSTTTSYTVTGLTLGTTYQMYVKAQDAARNESGASNTVNVTTLSSSPTLLAHYFETGWDGWTDGGGDCGRYSGSYSYEGQWSVMIRDNSGTASSTTSPALDLRPYTNVSVEFNFYANGMETGEDFWLRYYNGSTWQTIATFARGTNFNNGSFYAVTVPLNRTTYNFPSIAQFRFQCDASDDTDQIYVDAVRVTASGSSTTLGPDQITIRQLNGKATSAIATNTTPHSASAGQGLQLYPNPAGDWLNVRTSEPATRMRLLSVTGAVMQTITGVTEGDLSIDLSGLEPGVYFLSVEMKEGVVTKRFVKQ